MRWADEIYDAIFALGGAARHDDLYAYFRETADSELPRTWRAIVRRTVEDHSSGSAHVRGRDLFVRLERGFWGLRDLEVTPGFLEEREKEDPSDIVRRMLPRERSRPRAPGAPNGEEARAFHMIADGPRPGAPVSQAVESEGWALLTGQMPTDPDAPDAPLPNGIEAQTRRVMDNLGIILTGLGLDLGHVLQCRYYLTRFERDYEAFNRVYQGYFPADRRPARTTVGVTALAVGALVEIDCVARRPA